MSTRGRGRPAAGAAGDTRSLLIDAAREQFAARGFNGASLRSIARAAGVDPSLVGHYFGDREGLLVATLDLPLDPVERIEAALSAGREGLGERLVRTFLTSWDPHRDTFSALLRSSLGPGEPHAPAMEVARAVLVTRLTEALDGDALGADLVAAQILGLAAARYVIALDPLASTPIDAVVASYGAAVQAVVDA